MNYKLEHYGDKTIKRYKPNDDKIIIYYVGGEEKPVENTPENIKKLDEILLNQAIEFMGSSVHIPSQIKKDIDIIVYLSIFSGVGIALLSIIDDLALAPAIFTGVVGGAITLGGAAALTYGCKDYVDIAKRNHEIAKYRYYADMQNVLENNPETVSYPLTREEASLNYNTIDDYSFKEVKNIHDNFQRKRVYQKV